MANLSLHNVETITVLDVEQGGSGYIWRKIEIMDKDGNCFCVTCFPAKGESCLDIKYQKTK